ncbi:MAG: SRPBCC domain-containing protein [Saccharopolyspora sp.]|uniref:SRPBCC domain-containing protein n=1 Tax=Saccharopolyspora sp. TaxID=33915 RepID=UPI0025DB2D39|nr:SRPBCC domain-containing protein [Saccharopolyspora sp.]MBQ6642791.1 SRPBCC domain-containing protein [Saccharopolyspora sp.]
MTDGTVDRTDEHVTFHYERHVNQPIEAVWHTITDPAAIQQWMGTRPEIELRQGGQYVTHHGDDVRVADRVLRLEPLRLFEHTFFEYVNPGATVTWQLGRTPEDGCLLALTHVLSTNDVRAAMSSVAPGDGPITILSRNAAGWHQLLDLVQAQLGERIPTRSPDEQQALQQHYAELIQ